MKKLSLVFGLLFIISCKTTSTTYTANKSEVSKTLSYLTSDVLQGRDTGSEGIEKAAVFLENQLEANGIKPYFSTYRDTLTTTRAIAYNIVGKIEGTDPELKKEYLLIGAHYDHIGIVQTVHGDSIANGANDNASGVTMVSEIAKALSKEKLKRSVLIVYFSAEEKGLLGAKHLANKLKNDNFNLYAMLNFEMMGVPMKRSYTTYLTGYKTSNMAERMNAYANNPNLVGYFERGEQMGLFNASDNAPFYQVFKVPAQTICTFDFENFEYYHHVKDEYGQMDINHMTKLTNELIPVVTKMVNAPKGDIHFKVVQQGNQ